MESTMLPNSSITQKDFELLVNTHDTSCVSIYIPTGRAGKTVDERQGELRLKNCIKEVRRELQQRNYSTAEIGSILNPVELLLDEASFWKNLSDGLAIFCSKKELWYYSLPLHFETYTYVSDHFYLLPLMPNFYGDGKYYLLNLSEKHIQFFEGNRDRITEVTVEGLLPEGLDDAAEYDPRQKNLEFRSGKGSNGDTMFDGHGAGKDNFNKDLEKFFRLVDDGLMKLLGNEERPLILACQDQYFPIYQEVTSYAHLFKQFISTNPEHENVLLLHEKAWLLVKDFFHEDQKNRAEEFQNLQRITKASSELEKITRAAFDGRVGSLFVDLSKEIHGLYDQENRSVIIDEIKSADNASLINLIAVKSFMQGAKVYLVDPEEMPVKGTALNAIFRY
jgi:hypothetical protein